jgi:hypothetical protein
MGKSQSRMEEARHEISELESKGDSQKLREKLNGYVRTCRAQGELEEVVSCLNKLLSIQENATELTAKLELADTMYILGNTLRLQLQSVPDSSKPAAFPDEKERTKAFARAEDLLVRTLDIRADALKANPDSKDLKVAVARAKSALAMIQSSYGGRNEAAQAQHEGALEIFAEFPLSSDPEGWTLVKGTWTSYKSGVIIPPVVPVPSFASKSGMASEHSQSFRIDSRMSDNQIRTQRATTTNTHNPAQLDADDVSLTDDDTSAIPANNKRSTRWRLVIRHPRISERRPSALERLKRIGSLQNNVATLDSYEGVVQKIDLEPGNKIEVGLPISDAKRQQLESHGTCYIALGSKDKLSKVVSERHCCFEEDQAVTDETQKRWIIVDRYPSGGKYKGILVNGVRVNRAPLRPGDVIQIGNCSKIKMGSSAATEKLKSSKDPFANGVEFTCERVITTIDDTDVSSVAPAAIFETSDTTDTAFKHFHLLAVAAQMNLNGPALTIDQTSDLFAKAVKSGVPFNLWDSWIYSELSRARFVS